MVIERRPKKVIIDSLGKYPAVGLIGCRQAGKTTLVQRHYRKGFQADLLKIGKIGQRLFPKNRFRTFQKERNPFWLKGLR